MRGGAAGRVVEGPGPFGVLIARVRAQTPDAALSATGLDLSDADPRRRVWFVVGRWAPLAGAVPGTAVSAAGWPAVGLALVVLAVVAAAGWWLWSSRWRMTWALRCGRCHGCMAVVTRVRADRGRAGAAANRAWLAQADAGPWLCAECSVLVG